MLFEFEFDRGYSSLEIFNRETQNYASHISYEGDTIIAFVA